MNKLALVSVVVLLAACGAKGPLFLPKNPPASQVAPSPTGVVGGLDKAATLATSASVAAPASAAVPAGAKVSP